MSAPPLSNEETARIEEGAQQAGKVTTREN
jgi:hypothetical protein